MQQLYNIIPQGYDINSAFHNGDEEDRFFVKNIALFFDQFMKNHLKILENSQYSEYLFSALEYMLQITEVDDINVFDVSLDFWTNFVNSINLSY